MNNRTKQVANYWMENLFTNRIHIFGIDEETIASILTSLKLPAERIRYSYSGPEDLQLEIIKNAESDNEKQIENLQNKIKALLGDAIYGINAISLENVVIELLKKREQKIATAESCTGGLLAKRLTDIPGSSAVFDLGLVTYANSAKINLLNVDAELINCKGAVSRSVAMAMALGIRRLAKSHYGIGITGIAGPDGGSPQKPVGTVYIGLAISEEETFVKKIKPNPQINTRAMIRQHAASSALDLLRRYLIGLKI